MNSTMVMLRQGKQWRHIILVAVSIFCLFIAGLSWVIASPIGGSPDDDYHMGSIWCPRPAGESCPVKKFDGEDNVEVPVAVAVGAACHAFHPENSATHCPRPIHNNKKEWIDRYDDGNYPVGYYAFMHNFIVPNVGKAIIIMRTINLALALCLLGAIAALLRPEQLAPYLLTMFTIWMPMGFYFIASINPSSWAITGLYGYATGMYGSATSKDWRRWPLLGLALFGALMCFSSRRDVSFYLFVVAVAFIFAVRWTKENMIPGIVAAVIGIGGIFSMTMGGQSRLIVEGPKKDVDLFHHALNTFLEFPHYLAGMTGFDWGPGWFDVPLNGASTFIAMFASASVLLLALRQGNWRKWLSAGVILGAIFGIPLMLILKQAFIAFGDYQPRYMMPLVTVFVYMLFVTSSNLRRIIELPQLILITISLMAVNALALHMVLWRYVSGVRPPMPINLDTHIEWWWATLPFSPMQVWMIGAFTYAIACAGVMVLVWKATYKNSKFVPAVVTTEAPQYHAEELPTPR